MLERIQKANDIKKLNPQELEILAGEIREFLIEKISTVFRLRYPEQYHTNHRTQLLVHYTHIYSFPYFLVSPWNLYNFPKSALYLTPVDLQPPAVLDFHSV